MSDEDARLTDFLDAGDEEAEPADALTEEPEPPADDEPATTDGDESAEEASATAEEAPEADPDEKVPATTSPDEEGPAITCRWDPDGAECGSCGAVVRRRWRHDGAFVCVDCREW